MADAVTRFFFNLANSTRECGGDVYVKDPIKIVAVLNYELKMADSTSLTMTSYPKGLPFGGYDIISVFAHEIGHILDRKSGGFVEPWINNPEAERRNESVADRFAKNHWSIKKISEKQRNTFVAHANDLGYNWNLL